MKVNSWKKALLFGFLRGALLILTWIGFTFVINCLTGGEYFVDKLYTKDEINGISFEVVLNMAIVVSALVSSLSLWYTSQKYLAVSIPVCFVSFIGLFYLLGIIPGSLGEMLQKAYVALGTLHFDAIFYAIRFLLGIVIGTVISIIINDWINKKRKGESL
ncbi:MAG: hypothetical protein E7399_01230 [Ruminococcaceae bacterium]|nr:hypothetical protein [Oscillospiraceae bacterium]